MRDPSSETDPIAEPPPPPGWFERMRNALLFMPLAIVALAYQNWDGSGSAALRHRELVESITHGGATYTLYFHRRAKYFNSIWKDGELVFDGRDHPDLRACLQDLVIVEGAVHRRCYDSSRNEVVTAPLP